MNKSKKKKDLTWLIVVIGIFVSAVLTAILTNIELFSIDTSNVWVGFYGSVVGGLITLIGVYTTIKYNKDLRDEDLRYSLLPVFNVNVRHNENTMSGEYIIIDNEVQTEKQMFCFHMINVGIKSAKQFKISMIVNEKEEVDMGVRELISVNDKFDINLGVQVAKPNSKNQSKHNIIVKWEYKDLIGNVYNQSCNISLCCESFNDLFHYHATVQEIEEARYIGRNSHLKRSF